MKFSVYELHQKRALVIRADARKIGVAISRAATPDPGDRTLTLDFSGIEAVGPSFMDELLAVLAGLQPRPWEAVTFFHPPARLSEKFQVIGRGRQMKMSESPEGLWTIEMPNGRP